MCLYVRVGVQLPKRVFSLAGISSPLARGPLSLSPIRVLSLVQVLVVCGCSQCLHMYFYVLFYNRVYSLRFHAWDIKIIPSAEFNKRVENLFFSSH